MRARRTRTSRSEHATGEGSGLLEFDHQFLDHDVCAAEVAEVPLDAFARMEHHLAGIDSEVDLSAASFDVDADGHCADGKFGELVSIDQTIGRRRRRSDERGRLRAGRGGDE